MNVFMTLLNYWEGCFLSQKSEFIRVDCVGAASARLGCDMKSERLKATPRCVYRHQSSALFQTKHDEI